MNNFINSNYIYLYDGSFDGFLSVVYNSYKTRSIPLNICSEAKYINNLIDKTVYINTNYDFSNIVINSIKNKISLEVFFNIYNAFLSSNTDKEMIIYNYLFNAFKIGKNIGYYRNIKSVTELQRMLKNVLYENHRFKGFVRFSKTNKNILISKIKPENDILELLCNHFKYRLRNECFAIYDEARNKMAVYNKKEYIILKDTSIDFSNILSDDEKNFQELWKEFYETVAIKERKNRRCMLNFMPKKYWSNLLEMEGKI